MAQFTQLQRDQLFSKSAGNSGSGGSLPQGTTITSQNQSEYQKQALQQMEKNDQEIDNILDQIGNVVGEIGELANAMNEELTLQGELINEIDEKVGNAQDDLKGVNGKLKSTLEDSGMSGERVCVNVICLVVLLGVMGVLINMLSKNNVI